VAPAGLDGYWLTVTVPVPELAVAVVPLLLTFAGFAGSLVVALTGLTAAAVGVTAFDATDAALVPLLLVAATVNVYAVPLVNPVTAELVFVVLKPVQPLQAGVGVIVYPLIAEPPSLAGAL
jgi:hypothetical protein